MAAELEIRPHAGPQEAFLSTPADIAVYGGAAGGGKTWALLLDPMRWVRVPGFGAVIFRRTYPDIMAEGAMWDQAYDLYPLAGATMKENPPEAEFPGGTRISFAHMQHVKDRLRWKGAQIAMIGFDQLEEFEAVQFWYLTSRNRSTCGVRPYVRATCNPDPDSWVKELLAPWVDDAHPEFPFPPGELRHITRDGDDLIWVDADWRDADGQPARSLTFIPSTIYDNPTLLAADPRYLAALRALPYVDRMRLLGDPDDPFAGWRIREAGNMFRREWFPIVGEAPADIQVARSWDEGATEGGGDWTVGAKVGYGAGVWYVLDVVRERLSPNGVDALMDQCAALDGTDVEIVLQQEPGSSGKARVDGHRKRLKGRTVRVDRPTGDKVTRAKPMASAAEAGNLRLVEGDWNAAFINECVGFPGRAHDDQVDAVSEAILVMSRRIRPPGKLKLAPAWGGR